MSEESGSGGGDLRSVDFEIFGHVQGVCFRMVSKLPTLDTSRSPWAFPKLLVSCVPQYTERKGLNLGVVGWVKNTGRGTVVGQVQGRQDLVQEMKIWLSKEGSPSSRITRAVFKNERDIPKLELAGFSTRF
ncbi:acylphosphatase-2-like isoform X1 [Trichomycterus rosablanca]|uniref:acylphosphatase-2-like isoform X1 n=1 Tax=Trichomycterus rosablanca TaxID=2290929 RepID=UPI002F353E61